MLGVIVTAHKCLAYRFTEMKVAGNSTCFFEFVGKNYSFSKGALCGSYNTNMLVVPVIL